MNPPSYSIFVQQISTFWFAHELTWKVGKPAKFRPALPGKFHNPWFAFSLPLTAGRLRSLSATAQLAWFVTMGLGSPSSLA